MNFGGFSVFRLDTTRNSLHQNSGEIIGPYGMVLRPVLMTPPNNRFYYDNFFKKEGYFTFFSSFLGHLGHYSLPLSSPFSINLASKI